MDLSKLSDADLMALKGGDLSKVSTEGLRLLKGGATPDVPDGGTPVAHSAGSTPWLRGIPGAVVAGATGLAGQLAGRATALGSKVLGGSDEEAAQRGQRVASFITYEPSEAGKAVLSRAGKALEASKLEGMGPMAIPAGAAVQSPSKLGVAMQKKGVDLMQSALKPGKRELLEGTGREAAETMLKRGANVTFGGVEKLTSEIDKLDDALSAVIKNAKPEVNVLTVIRPVKQALDDFKFGLDHAQSQEAILGELDKFLSHPAVAGSGLIDAETAQQLKRGIYAEVGDKGYGIGLKPAAEREGKKAIARGLKEGIEEATPFAKNLNKQMGDLINARDLAEARAMMAANRGQTGVATLGGSKLGSVLHLMDRSPLMTSLAARGMYSAGGALPGATIPSPSALQALGIGPAIPPAIEVGLRPPQVESR